MEIEIWPLARVRPYLDNPRRNADAVPLVAKSIAQYGFRQPIVVDAEGTVIAGHTRLRAAAELGLTEVPVLVAADLSPDQARAYRIADNKTADFAYFDDKLLLDELARIEGDWFTGFVEPHPPVDVPRLPPVDDQQSATFALIVRSTSADRINAFLVAVQALLDEDDSVELV